MRPGMAADAVLSVTAPLEIPVFPVTQKKTSALDAMSTRFVASRFTTSQRTSTSAMMCLIFSFSFPLDLPGNFISALACGEARLRIRLIGLFPLPQIGRPLCLIS
jgi:hypothetical protein